MAKQNVNGYALDCDKLDTATIGYKIMGLPFAMRDLVASQYSNLYRTTLTTYPETVGDDNPVIQRLAKNEARTRANAYLASVMQQVKDHVGKETYLETPDRLKLQFLMLWEQHAPDSILLDKEQQDALDDESAKELKRQRLARRNAIKAFLAAENITYPGGTNDDKNGNGSRYNRLVNRKWLQDQVRVRVGRSSYERARQAGRIGKHKQADLYITEEDYQKYLDSKASAMQYMKDTVFISHEDDEVEMLDVYNSTTANPRNRKTQLMTQVAGMVKYADKHGYAFAMITPTAASEHHPAPRLEDGEIRVNPRYLAAKPNWTTKKTHEHLNAIAERVFSALDREGVEFYGFKGIEAHKDGTPHHHYGFFYKDVPGNKRKVHSAFAWYFQELDKVVSDGVVLGDVGKYKHRRKMSREQQAAIKQHLHDTQPGAAKRRVTFVYHDATKGSLSNYILKSLLNYVIKDVADKDADGDAIDLTEKQQDAAARQQRIAAWASLNGIRQFSTIRTGASMGVYQELRRIHSPVEGSVQLEQERLACVGSYGTEQHQDPETRLNADFCRYMELRRNPLDDAEPVELWKVTDTESDNITIKFNEFSDEVGRVQGVRCNEDANTLLEINTRPIKWRAINLPMLIDDLAETELPPTQPGDLIDPDYRAAVTKVWSDIVTTARTDKTVHELARGVYHHPLSPAVGVSFRDRAKPITTWKIRNNPTFSGESSKNGQMQQGGDHVHVTA